MNYRPEHFALHELVPPDVLDVRGETAWELIDPSLLMALDGLRKRFGRITVNDWHWGGKYRESGYRTPETKTGARFSMHKAGKAADCKFADTTPQAVYEAILESPDDFPWITCLENIEKTVGWLHVDVRNCERVKVVNP
jgi:hypothetical protein